MGSFNTVCCASQQIITPGDACYLVPIKQSCGFPVTLKSRAGNEHTALPAMSAAPCYPSDLWSPVGGVIAASYDDYGRFKLNRSDEASLNNVMRFFTMLYHEAPETVPGANQGDGDRFHFPSMLEKRAPLLWAELQPGSDVGESDELEPLVANLEACWKELWDAIWNRRCFFRSSKSFAPLGVAVIHQAAYEQLIDVVQADWHCAQRLPAPRAYFDEALQTAKERASASVKDTKSTQHAVFFGHVLRNSMDLIGHCRPRDSVLEDLSYLPTLQAYVQGAASADELFRLMEPGITALYAMRGLELLNIKLQPMAYGGQDYRNEIGSRYASFINATQAVVTRQRREALDWDADD